MHRNETFLYGLCDLVKIRVLHVVRTHTTVDAFLLPIIAEQLSLGHQVELAFGQDADAGDHYGVPVHTYPIRRSFSPFMLFRSARALGKIISQGNYDVVVSHMVMGGIVGRLACAMANTQAKVIYASHGLPCFPERNMLLQKMWLCVERVFSRWTDMITVLNRYDYQIAEKYHLAGRGGRVELLKSVGINNDVIRKKAAAVNVQQMRTSLGLDPSLSLVIYAGRFIKAKGAHVFLGIAANILKSGENINFILAGCGPLEDYLKRIIAKEKLSNSIKILGWRSDTIELLAASDVLCFPTSYEGAPVIIQEAMASGTVVLSSKVPGPEDLIDDKENGLLVSAGDIDGFSDALLSLLSNPEKREELSMCASNKALEYDVTVCVSQWAKAIEMAVSVR